MEKCEIKRLVDMVGQEASFYGWIDGVRDHRAVVFLDVRSRGLIVQVVVANKEILEVAKKLNAEDLILVKGLVKKRPERLINQNIETGTIEVEAINIEIVSVSNSLPFEINNDTISINESKRLKYRYLDLRSGRMQRNIACRHQVNLFFRNYFSELDFFEVETPCLTKGTPEGSREFIVPSRLHSGQFYVLPQSPQQFKQLLMVGGIEKYYQIARCFRDEDQRGDRQPEFTQLDLEMSFVDQEIIIQIMEKALVSLVESKFPHLKIQSTPFPRITYKESIEKYKTDKPDLRREKDKNLLAFCWVVDFPLFEFSAEEKKIVSSHHPFTHPAEEDIAMLEKDPLKVRAMAYDIVLNGFEIGGGSIRIFKRELQEKIFSMLGLSPEEIEARFGHMLEAFRFSPPPHGGIALGLDRLISILLSEENIREVIAFPKTGDAKDLLCGAPSPLPVKTLKEVHINLEDKKHVD